MVESAPLPAHHSDEVVFRESSFFRKYDAASLPSPAEVRDAASRSNDPKASNRARPPPVCFDIGVLVKYGIEVTSAEGQCLILVREAFCGTVPVPEVYKWCMDDEQTFIYMEMIEGVTLEKAWDDMIEDDRLAICRQLRDMINTWRILKGNTSPNIIGHVGKQPLLDVIFTSTCCPIAGPFSSVPDFHDWYTSAYGPDPGSEVRPPHPYRSFLPDTVPVVFTHEDLHPSNILVSAGPNPGIVATIDWHQSGWYPAYWEYCKARWTSYIGQDWEAKYLPLLLDRYSCYDYWDYFVLARGA